MDRDLVIERSRAQLPLLKINPGAVVRVKVLPVGPAWFTVHWVGKRQVLCAARGESGCMACGVAPGRVVGFVLVTTLLVEKERLFLLEVSPLALNSLEMSAQFEGISTNASVWCDVSRHGARRPLRFEAVEESRYDCPQEAATVRLMNAVAVLYGLPLMIVGECVSSWEERVAATVASFAERAVLTSGISSV